MWSIPPECVDRIREALGPDWTVESLDVPLHATGDGAASTPRRLLEAIADAEVYCGFGISPEALRAGRRLRWVHSGAAGVGGSLFPEMLRRDVVLTNSAGIHAEPMAEHALAMILYFSRGLDIAVAGMRAREWRHERLTGPDLPPREVSGRVLGVVGYGGIGSAVGRKGAALGMRVRAIRRDPRDVPPELERLEGPDGLTRLLSEADFLVLAVPETSETRGLIGREELRLLGESAVLVNLSRGGVVDEEALLDALEERRLRGAGLDVFAREPLPPDSRFWTVDRVLITPHTGGVSRRFWGRETDLVVDNVHRYLAGEPLRNRVDKERGY